jgi:hypothetical protein
MPKGKHDWTKLDPLIDNLKAQDWTDTQIAKDLGISRQTLVDHLRSRAPSTPMVHPGTPEYHGVPPEHLGVQESIHHSTPEHTDIPEHLGTLEGHQEVMEDVSQSVPDAPHIGTEGADQGLLEHLSTPVVHPEVSQEDSHMAHSGVPARQEHVISTPAVHPSTPTEEDWQLWAVMKTRWTEVEKMLADWQTRQALLSTPSGTPRHTIKKTYVVDTVHVDLIDRYAREHGMEIKDVLYLALQQFFEGTSERR